MGTVAEFELGAFIFLVAYLAMAFGILVWKEKKDGTH